jgi:hypothetical protein
MYLLKAYQLITGKYRFSCEQMPSKIACLLGEEVNDLWPSAPIYASRLRDLTQSNAELGPDLEPVWGYWNDPISLSSVAKSLNKLNKVLFSSGEDDLKVLFEALPYRRNAWSVYSEDADRKTVIERVLLFDFNISYCSLFNRLDRLHKLLLKQFPTVSDQVLRTKKRWFVSILNFVLLILGRSSGTNVRPDQFTSEGLMGLLNCATFFSTPTAPMGYPFVIDNRLCLEKFESKELFLRLEFIFLCLGSLPETFMDFLIYVCMRTIYLSWSEFKCLWGPLTASILTLIRAGLKRFVRRYAVIQNQVKIEVRAAYNFLVPSRVSYLLAKKMRTFLGKDKDFKIRICVRQDDSVGCGLVVLVGRDRLVVDFRADTFFSAFQGEGLVFKPSWT